MEAGGAEHEIIIRHRSDDVLNGSPHGVHGDGIHAGQQFFRAAANAIAIVAVVLQGAPMRKGIGHNGEGIVVR